MLLPLLPFAEEDTPSTTVTPLPHLQTMSSFKEGEIKTGAGLSTGEGKNSNYQTVLNHKRGDVDFKSYSAIIITWKHYIIVLFSDSILPLGDVLNYNMQC